MNRKKAWLLFKKRPFWITIWLLLFLLFTSWAGGAKVQLEIKIGNKVFLPEVSLLTKEGQNLVAVEELFPQIKGIAYYSPIMKKIHLAYGSTKWTISLDKGEAISGDGKTLSLNINQVSIKDQIAYVAIPLLEQFFGWQISLKDQAGVPSVTPTVSEKPKVVPSEQILSLKNSLLGVRFYTHQDQRKTRVTLDFSKTPPLHEIKESESQIYLYLSECVPGPGLGEVVKVGDERVDKVWIHEEEGKTVVNIGLKRPVKVTEGVLGGSKPRIFLDITDLEELKPPVSAETKSEVKPQVEEKAPLGETSLPEEQVNLNVVVIDPGHGGKDPGCIQNGYQEKDVVLAISLKLKKVLEEKGFQVYLTRDRDVYPSLSERMQVANTRRPFVFLSLHCNAAPSPKAQGVEIFVGNAHYQGEGAQEVAARENQFFQSEVTSSTGNAVGKILSDSFYLKSREAALKLADYLLNKITGETGQTNRGVKMAPLIVLSDVLFPACLVEVGFLSNPMEAKNLASPAFQDKLAQAIAEGIVAFRNSSALQKYVSGNGQ